uniref:Uncharacterized protein n=1 Tax=uncultured marine virus TaxID=186617 RepID=A0A0F7L7V2_9VIRU|nr:hypothetical protein [uncultured marine virus]
MALRIWTWVPVADRKARAKTSLIFPRCDLPALLVSPCQRSTISSEMPHGLSILSTPSTSVSMEVSPVEQYSSSTHTMGSPPSWYAYSSQCSLASSSPWSALRPRLRSLVSSMPGSICHCPGSTNITESGPNDAMRRAGAGPSQSASRRCPRSHSGISLICRSMSSGRL